VFLSADEDRDGTYEAMTGDTVHPNTPVRVRVVGAPGATLRLVTDGGRPLGPDAPVGSADSTTDVTVPATATWLRAEVFGNDAPAAREPLCSVLPVADLAGETTYCKNRVAMLALTGALYFRPAKP
jgi:hypothetical protein